MAIKVSARGSGGNYTPHPEGQFAAVCCDVSDVGMVQTVWSGNARMVHKVDLYFFCGEWLKKEDGTSVPMLVRERFTASLHEKSKLRPFVEKLLGRKLTDEEADDFDLESVMGMGAMIEVVHNETDTSTFANIDSVMRLPKGATLPEPPAGYVRVQDRPPRDGEKPNARDPIAAMAYANRKDQRQAAKPSPFSSDDDDLPF